MRKLYLTTAIVPAAFLLILAMFDLMGAGRSLDSGSCGQFLDCLWFGLTQGRIEMLGLTEAADGTLTGYVVGNLLARDLLPAALFLLVALLAHFRWTRSLRLLLGCVVLVDLLNMIVLNKAAVFGVLSFAVLALLLIMSFFLRSDRQTSKHPEQAEVIAS